MLLKTFVTAAISSVLLTASVSAGGHLASEQRIMAMKAIGGQMRPLAGMARGASEYDDLAVISALETMRNAAASAQPMFAEPTPDGEETRALPAIWADGSDFDARMAGLVAAIDAAIAAEPADAAALGPLFGAVAGTCKGCHEAYRAPEE